MPEWAVFGRYDSVDPKTKTAPLMNDNYYTFGITYSPVKIVDFSLAYKHDDVGHGTLRHSNGNHRLGFSLQTGTLQRNRPLGRFAVVA